jgi:Putative metal-binding motif
MRCGKVLGVLVAFSCACSQSASSAPRSRAAATVAQPTGVTGASSGAAGTSPGDSIATVANPADAGLTTPVVALCGGKPCGADMPITMRVPDDDGFSVADGDCDDFNAGVNPGAYDVPNNGIDEDCQGGDATSDVCDDALALDASDPLMAARAIELCAQTQESSRRWGVISARWTTPDGKGTPSSDMMHGLLPGFGSAFAPRAGKSLLALSSGVARAPAQKGYTADCSDSFSMTKGDFPAGFDGSSPSCPADAKADSVGDAIALEVRVRMPSNASALSFDSAFFTEEYPDYICSPFNDYFQVIVQPARSGGMAGDGNVELDTDGNPVSVNNSLLQACKAGNHGGKMFACPLGVDPLKGTGYDECDMDSAIPGGGFGGLFGGGGEKETYGASTGWLNTEFAVMPGEVITMRFTIWDSDDTALDSLAIIDHVRFRLRSEPPPPEVPVTQPIAPE